MSGEKQRAKRVYAAYLLAAAALVIAAAASFCVGKYPISPQELLALMTGGEVKEMTRKVFFTLRVSRTWMAIFSGAGLGLAGAVYQIIFKNPLASPDIIGVSSGANLGAAVAIVAVNGVMGSVAVGAFAGGLLAVALVMLLVRATRSTATSTYVLAGIIISALSKTGIMLLKYFADSEAHLAAMEYWTMGSLSAVTASRVWEILPYWTIGFVGLLLLHRQIQLLSLNEEECQALGVRLKPVRRTVLALSTLLVAAIISVTGLISFVGLIAPHIANLMIRRRDTHTMLLSSLIGAVVMVASDILARALYAAELPVSTLTTLIGVPVLVWFMCRRKEGRI